MARKEVEITIKDGRDAGKVFKITEMGAVQSDRWATKVVALLGKAGADISVLGSLSFQDLVILLSKAPAEEVQPLYDELLACASFVQDGNLVPLKGSIVDSIVEEWTTLNELRLEALKLTLGFFEEGGESTSK